MRIIESPSGAYVTIDGIEYLNFAGSCYLGICDRPEIIEAAKKAVEINGAFAQIPKHYGFNVRCNMDAEAAIAKYFGTEDAFYFMGGYLFGSMAFQGLRDDYDVIYLDEMAHFALKDGAKCTGKPIYTFSHCDPLDLKRVMDETLEKGQIPAIGCDGIFPTLGNISPLGEYFDLIEPLGGYLIVDESHSLGVLGDKGRGAIEKFNLPRDKAIGGGSAGKGFCAYGGIAVGSKELMDKFVYSPPGRGASAGMTSAAAATAASLNYIMDNPRLLTKLRENIAYFRKGLKELGISTLDSESPVIAFQIRDGIYMRRLQAELYDKHQIFLLYSTYIGAGHEGVIRSAAFSDHEFEDIDRLLSVLKAYL